MSTMPLSSKQMLPTGQNSPLAPKRLLRIQQQDLIVITSDSECDEEGETNSCDQSVYIVDMDVEKENVPEQAPKVVDEDLIITFSQRANVLPHARYDCPVYPFQPTDERRVPMNSNFLICEQCYCYVCDKPASQCDTWTVANVCHCNSHKRNDYWRGLRDARLLGFLKAFSITLCEMDSHLREAEVMLGSFTSELAKEYSSFLVGSQQYFSSSCTIYDYTPVYECVWMFLNKADGQEDKAAAVMRLGAAKHFMEHQQPAGPVISKCPKASATTAKVLLIERVIVAVQQQMVLANFTAEFSAKLHLFYRQLRLPSALSFRLTMRFWDDPLLVSVLRGQNVTGVQKSKGGKKDTLIEELPVILLRVQHLQKEHKYRELCRYLRVVLCVGGLADDQTRFQEVTDLIPLYLCWAGEFHEAISQFTVASQKCPTQRLSPFFFMLYLHILETGTAPVLTAQLPTQETLAAAKWEKIQGAVPRVHKRLVVASLRVMKIRNSIYSHSGCWETLLSMVNMPRDTPVPLEKPCNQYLEDARVLVRYELNKPLMDNICFPVALMAEYPDQCVLLMMTEALAMRIVNGGPLVPAIPVVNTFKDNEWAFQWLCDSLMSYSPDIYHSFMKALLQELPRTPTVTTAAASHEDTNAACVCGKICKNDVGLRIHQRRTGCKDAAASPVGAATGPAQTSAGNTMSHWLLPHPLSYYYPSLSVSVKVTH